MSDHLNNTPCTQAIAKKIKVIKDNPMPRSYADKDMVNGENGKIYSLYKVKWHLTFPSMSSGECTTNPTLEIA